MSTDHDVNKDREIFKRRSIVLYKDDAEIHDSCSDKSKKKKQWCKRVSVDKILVKLIF